MWAHDRLGERRLFEGYVYLVHERLTRDAGMHVYHYGAYEKAATTQLMGVYATREDAVDELLRRKGFPPSTASHAGGHWFKSSIVHHETSRNPEGYTALRVSCGVAEVGWNWPQWGRDSHSPATLRAALPGVGIGQAHARCAEAPWW